MVYSEIMIKSFKHKGLKELYEAGKTSKIKPDFIDKCIEILTLLDNAERLEDFTFAGYKFHGLQGKPKRYSLKVSRNYSITFEWDKEPIKVDFEDYH